LISLMGILSEPARSGFFRMTGMAEEIETGHLAAGDQITIANGKFKGQEAVIKEIGNNRLRLVLGTMGFVVNVRLSEALEG